MHFRAVCVGWYVTSVAMRGVSYMKSLIKTRKISHVPGCAQRRLTRRTARSVSGFRSAARAHQSRRREAASSGPHPRVSTQHPFPPPGVLLAPRPPHRRTDGEAVHRGRPAAACAWRARRWLPALRILLWYCRRSRTADASTAATPSAALRPRGAVRARGASRA